MTDDAFTTAQSYYRAAREREELTREREDRIRAQEQRIERSLRRIMILTTVSVVFALISVSGFVAGL